MNDTLVQWIGSSCGRHGGYTFYKGFKINSQGKEKSYCLGEFYFVRNSEDRPICIAELQLIWHDASNDSKLASARLYFKPENTPFGRQSIHGQDELLYADQKVIIKCEDMAVWECSGSSWKTGLTPTLESDFIPLKDVTIDKFTGKPENKYRLQNKPLDATEDIPAEKIIILTFQAYCRYIALQKRLLTGVTIAKSEIASLGGIIAPSKATKIVFCRESFSCPDVDQFHLSGENKAPVLKGRPRKKKKPRSSTLAKELKRKRFLADLERVKKNLPSKKMKLSESEEGTESDLSEESNKSYESMDEDKPCISVETPVNKVQQPNGLLPVKIKPVSKVMSTSDKDLKNTIPPPLIPTLKVKLVPASPPPLQKVKLQTESPVVPKLDNGPPPLYPAVQKLESGKKASQSVPRLLPRVDIPSSNRVQGCGVTSASSKVYTPIKSSSTGLASTSSSPTSTGTRPEVSVCNGIKAAEPLCNVSKQMLVDGKPSREQDMKMEGKENQQDRNKGDVSKKKRRIRQPCNVKELSEEFADEDEKCFMRSLREFMKSRNTPISKIPALGFKRVNLWTMYNTAQKLGGYDMVTSKRLWRQVYDALGGSTTITSAATYTRRHYERLLLPYESYVRSQLNNKKVVPEPAQHPSTSTSQDSTSKGHPVNNTNLCSTTENNDGNSITNDIKPSNHDNGRRTDGQPVPTSASKNGSPLASPKVAHSKPPDLVKQTGVTKMTTPITTGSKLIVNSNASRHGSSNAVVKVKPNGVLPPYSVSVQRAEKDVTSSPFVIVTKSISDPSSSLKRSSTTITLPKYSSAPTLISKVDTQGTSGSTSTPARVTPSHSTHAVVSRTPVKPSATVTLPSSSKREPVKVVHVQNPEKRHSVTPQQPTSVTSPKIYLPEKKTCPSKATKENGYRPGMAVNCVNKSAPVSNSERLGPKIVNPEKHGSEPTRIGAQSSLNLARGVKHAGEPVFKDRVPHLASNARDTHTYDVSSQQSTGRSYNKRSAQNEFDEMKRKIPDKGFQRAEEPVAKRRKSPSPAVTKVTPQPADVIQAVTTQSRNANHSNALYSSRHAIKPHEESHGKMYNTHAKHLHVTERKAPQVEQVPIKPTHARKDVVDLTDSSTVRATVNDPITYHKPSKSPSYTRVSHPKQQYLEDSCQRTEPRVCGNVRTRVNQTKELTASLTHHEDKQPRDSHLSRAHYKEPYPNHQHNYRVAEDVRLTPERKQSKAKVDPAQMNSEVHRTVTHRTFTESPDEHFEEWRRRQGMTQYPAYITVNQNEPARRSSITDQSVSLCPRTPPESRYVYVQDDGGLHPRVIEEVPLILSSKPGVYYQEDSFYGGMPFYHGGWGTAGVADGVTFKGDPEAMAGNNHLRSSSCIFMPSSQMFGSAVPITPLSPQVLNQGHVVSGQETVGIHPHLLMTSPYAHGHQMVSKNPTRPLHSYT